MAPSLRACLRAVRFPLLTCYPPCVRAVFAALVSLVIAPVEVCLHFRSQCSHLWMQSSRSERHFQRTCGHFLARCSSHSHSRRQSVACSLTRTRHVCCAGEVGDRVPHAPHHRGRRRPRVREGGQGH
eukprot:3932709-Rhodomonas_salina.1